MAAEWRRKRERRHHFKEKMSLEKAHHHRRPWIHALGVVPSTLHQKLKFAVGGLLVIVSGEEDMLVSCPSSAPYVEAAEE